MTERLNQYLAREAGDYLDQLIELLRSGSAPEPESLHRLARGVRGSAQMAGASAVAPVAARLEEAAREVASGAEAWTERVRGLVLDTAEDLRLLLGAIERWGPDEDARARAAVGRWERRSDDVVPISALFHDDDGPHVLSRPARVAREEPMAEPPPAESAVDAGEVVPVESLLFEGDDALREALALRPRLEALLAAEADAAETAAVLDELFDLVRLAQTEGRPAA